MKNDFRMLNIGCGRCFDPKWINVDLDPVDKTITKLKFIDRLPFDDCSMSVVYHSHLLEHLDKKSGELLIKECYRITKKGGVLRVVVPDLEMIAREYISSVDRVNNGDESSIHDHEWMIIEMIDQMVRIVKGGEMFKYLDRKNVSNIDFIAHRVGDWVRSVKNGSYWDNFPMIGLIRKLKRLTMKNFSIEGTGERHMWMYDYISLKKILEKSGFRCVNRVDEKNSSIKKWRSYNLDSIGEKIRKPDSLFVEAIK